MIKRYVADRMYLIAAYYAALTFVVLVVWLDMQRFSWSADSGNMLYAFVLATVALAAALALDYARQRSFYRQMDDVLSDARPELVEDVRLDAAATTEQRLFERIVARQYEAYTDKLAVYRKQAEQHNDFTNRWVHHMKTPVSVIDLLVQQAEGDLSPGAARELLRSVREENERIARGLDMMLHTARLDKFALDLHPERMKLLDTVRAVINGHKKACIRWSIYPKLAFDDPDAAVDSDGKWLLFVIDQIVTNAIKYAKDKPGDKTLTFALEQTKDGCELHIADEGIGIAEHELPRVFDAFYTGQNGRLVAESTGMGLYLAKQVCNRLGHRLDIRSKLGVGTTVVIGFATGAIHKVTNS